MLFGQPVQATTATQLLLCRHTHPSGGGRQFDHAAVQGGLLLEGRGGAAGGGAAQRRAPPPAVSGPTDMPGAAQDVQLKQRTADAPLPAALPAADSARRCGVPQFRRDF